MCLILDSPIGGNPIVYNRVKDGWGNSFKNRNNNNNDNNNNMDNDLRNYTRAAHRDGLHKRGV